VPRSWRNCYLYNDLTSAVAFVGEKDRKLADLIEEASNGRPSNERLLNHGLYFEKSEGEKFPLTGLLSRRRSFGK
jgi:hypothetical protein